MRFPLAFLAALALVATACGPGDPVDVDDPTDEEAVEGGTLVAALGGDPDQLDPHLTTSGLSFDVLENIYDTLVQPGEDLVMEPALAESWDTSDDLLTWTFQLREGVTFHDGSDLTAEDVVASFERIAEEGANAFRLDAVDEFNVVDDHTVELVLNRPAPNLLEQMEKTPGEVARRLSAEAARATDATQLHLDEKTFRWMHNEDQMATEKLAEGIRRFDADARKLESLVATLAKGERAAA